MAQQVIQIKHGQIDECERAFLIEPQSNGRGITVSQFARYTNVLGNLCDLSSVGFDVSDNTNAEVSLGATWEELENPLNLTWTTGQEVRLRLYARLQGQAWTRGTPVGGTQRPIEINPVTTQVYEAILGTDGTLQPVSAVQNDDWEVHLQSLSTTTSAQLAFTDIDKIEAALSINKTVPYTEALRPMLIDCAETAEETIRGFCGRSFEAAAQATRTFYSDSYRILLVDDISNATVTVTVDSATVDSDNYRLNKAPSSTTVATALLPVRTYCWPIDYPIQVQATYGWAKTPPGIIQAATELAIYNYNSARQGHIIGAGDYGYQYVRARVPNVMRMLTPYMRRSAN